MQQSSSNDMEAKKCFAVNRWQLSELKTVYETEYKAVYSSVAAEYGPVILKINQDTAQLAEEYALLHQLNGAGCCKVYAYDEAQGMLLEECLLPGTVLREEEALEKRIGAFQSVFCQIHQDMSVQNATDMDAPIYRDWLEDVCQYCEEHHVDGLFADRAKQARAICEEMFAKYPERILLHGDLHHDNILLRADGTYGMIDPKGVIGPEILDIPRFIMNEIDTKHTGAQEQHMRAVVCAISEAFFYPLEDVAKVYFMEVVLGNLWCLQDGEDVNAEEIEIAEKIFVQCDEI